MRHAAVIGTRRVNDISGMCHFLLQVGSHSRYYDNNRQHDLDDLEYDDATRRVSMTEILQETTSAPSQPDASRRPYRMTVDLNILDHLGINLYSNMAAVLTEAVANSWDADAQNVAINVERERTVIEIVDDGVGMTVDDMNEKYLRIGYRRREDDKETGKHTAKGRQIMGRKGLGKLSLFSIAEVIEVQSVKDGQPAHGLRMTVDGIRTSINNGDSSYSPEALPDDQLSVQKGTKIVLRDIKRQRLGPGVAALRKRLARRFTVIGEQFDFTVTIDRQPIKPNDRGDLSITQFLWTFGNFERDPSSSPNVLEQQELPNRCQDWPEHHKVNGWIGTAHTPKQLDREDTGNLNGIVVFARGRLFHENILEKVNDGRLYTKYLTGQLEADFLDQDDKTDIATSDRQRVQEDDERYVQLLSFVKASLTQVEKHWTQRRGKHEVKSAKETSPGLRQWFATLSEGLRPSAETMIAKLSALPVEDDDNRKLLYRHGILAFERMRLRDSTEGFVSCLDDVGHLLRTLADRDVLEASLYRDIVSSRLDAIKQFQHIVDEDAKEKVFQKYLFDHLWLLDSSWERATDSELMETRLMQEGVIVDDLTRKEKLGRVDIKYRTTAGKHIIVELKRAGRKMKILELVEQGLTYVRKLKKILLAQGTSAPNIEVVFVLGKPVDEENDNPDQIKAFMAGISPGSRIVHYDALIEGARIAYSEYLGKSEVLDRIEGIVNRI